jgi:hypothetical protein
MEPVNLNCIPSCSNCLAWSSDGILAVAAGDYTNLLVPRVSPREIRPDPNSLTGRSSPWHSLKIRTNQFAFREWPNQDPLSYKNFSLGEEQSNSKVTALAWSPEGLGKNRRCVLGVLTSNCVLSLWEAEFHPREAGSWKRTGIVNDALRKYFDGVLGGGDEMDPDDLEELKRKKRRIRSFTWSPKLRGESYDPHNHSGLRNMKRTKPGFWEQWRIYDSPESPENAKDTADDRKWGIFYIAIANDDNDIILAQVYRDSRLTDLNSMIYVDVISHLRVSPSRSRMPMVYPDNSLGDMLGVPTHVRRLCWGPWSHGDSAKRGNKREVPHRSLLASLHGSTLQFCRIGVTEEQETKWVDTGKNKLAFAIEFVKFLHKMIDVLSIRFDGSLLWCTQSILTPNTSKNPTAEEDDRFDTVPHYHLAVISDDSVTMITFPRNIYRHSHSDGQNCQFCSAEESNVFAPQSLTISQRNLSELQAGSGRFRKVFWEQTIGIALFAASKQYS